MLRRNLFAVLVPRRLRTLHRWYAYRLGYFWLPCPLCGEEFGGHEWRADIRTSSTHTLVAGTQVTKMICPRCTLAGKGTGLVWSQPKAGPDGQ